MKSASRTIRVLTVLGAIAMVCGVATTAKAVASGEVRSGFAAPTVEYSTAPLWVWNDMMSEEQVRQSLRDMASQHVMQAFVHPRPGLMTPYLSDQWFAMWKVALDEAKKLGMRIWIYDENSYPSGFAGGFLGEVMPEARGRGLKYEDVEEVATPLGEDVLAVYRLDGDAYTNVTKESSLPKGKYCVVTQVFAPTSPWFAGKTNIDHLIPGATEKFLEITLDACKAHFGDEFGKLVPGSFTDEPHLGMVGLHWTPDLPEAFQKRWGYDIMANLPSLVKDVGDWRRVRHNYYQLLNELFIERWAKPYYEYCERNNLAFTGHYWEHEWPNTTTVPDNMAMGAWQHVPGIDILFNQYNEGVHAQVGNDRAVIELASVANQLGRQRRLCEAYGGGGWDLRFEDMKRIGDWISVLGVNFIDQHLVHSTLRGARKGDYPQTFSYHATWWDAYGIQGQYLTRVSYAMSQGEQINTVLVLEPTSTMWMYQVSDNGRLNATGEDFQRYVTQLAKDNVEFDLGCEYILANWGRAENGKLIVGKRTYDLVVLPVHTENLDDATMSLLETYLAQGGAVLCEADQPPAYVDGNASDRGVKASQAKGWQKPGSATTLQDRQAGADSPFSIVLDKKADTVLYHQRRTLDDGELVFLVNTSDTVPASGKFRSVMKGVEEWNLETGETGLPYPFDAKDGGVQAAFEVPPCGSLLLFLSRDTREPVKVKPIPAMVNVAEKGDLTVKRATSNVLTLDYVDVTVGGEKREAQYYYGAAELIFQKHGLDRNPWDHAVQFKDELISKTFAPDSGFEATYHFNIEGDAPKGLRAVVERPDLYAITCNGTTVTAIPGEWWTDRAWGVIDIDACVKSGDNTLTIKAQPFTMFHELERAYILGEFSLKSTDKGFAIATETGLALGAWNVQGCPFYGAGVTYTQRFDIPRRDGRVEVVLGDWLGSVVKVRVNGENAGYIYHRPFTCDISKWVKPGENTVEVEVIGTNKNTLGPHHGNPPLGIAAPDMFRKGPVPGPPAGTEYSTLGYGLFTPFRVRCEK
ncbi:MAG: hypothetical protein K1Y02_16225 [Candidatus Hydrogenedentes bacterium]|nr:hypothetical protein [Candidatus Hydrogenedentota bacterium]